MAARLASGRKPELVGLDHLGDHPRIGERVVGAEHDALGPRHLIERAESRLVRRERVVVPEMPQPGEHLLARELRQPLVDHRRHRQPPGKVRRQPAGMRQDETDARKTLDRAGEDEIHHRPRGVEQILHHEARPRQGEPLARRMQAGMDEHHGAARVERVQHRIEERIAEKFLAIARKQRDAVVLEHVERVRDLVDRPVHVPHRHGAEGAEALGPARDQLGRIVVAAARQRLRARRVPKPTPGCASEVSATSMPCASISSSASSGVQSG